MGMTEQEFRISTPEYYMLRLYGMRKLNEAQSKERWEIARYISLRARTAMSDPKDFPAGFFDLPWDEVQERYTDDEWREFNRMMDERFPIILA